jgi:hypothetical protein
VCSSLSPNPSALYFPCRLILLWFCDRHRFSRATNFASCSTGTRFPICSVCSPDSFFHRWGSGLGFSSCLRHLELGPLAAFIFIRSLVSVLLDFVMLANSSIPAMVFWIWGLGFALFVVGLFHLPLPILIFHYSGFSFHFGLCCIRPRCSCSSSIFLLMSQGDRFSCSILAL